MKLKFSSNCIWQNLHYLVKKLFIIQNSNLLFPNSALKCYHCAENLNQTHILCQKVLVYAPWVSMTKELEKKKNPTPQIWEEKGKYLQSWMMTIYNVEITVEKLEGLLVAKFYTLTVSGQRGWNLHYWEHRRRRCIARQPSRFSIHFLPTL